jgi:hypothetical protein
MEPSATCALFLPLAAVLLAGHVGMINCSWKENVDSTRTGFKLGTARLLHITVPPACALNSGSHAKGSLRLCMFVAAKHAFL